MSLVHYLSIGRFTAASDMPQPTLLERVVAHLTPGGLARLGAPAAPAPLTDQEIDRLERVLKEAWELPLDLRSYLRDGVLTVPYTGEAMYRVAWPIAAVAREELGLTVAERGRPFTDAQIRTAAEDSRADNAATRALCSIEDGEARVRAAADEVRRGRRSSYHAHMLLHGLGAEIVPAVASLLTDEARLQVFACDALGALGPAAVAALPAFEELFRREALGESIALHAAGALAKIGPAAQAVLSLSLAHKAARETALMALAAIPELARETRARVVPLAQGDSELAQLARHALGESTIAKRLAVLRTRHGNIDVPDDLQAWAEALPDDQVAAVVAAALDARSARSMPRAGALKGAIAAAVRAGNASDRIPELEEEHDAWTIRWPDAEFQHVAIAGLVDREALVWTVCELKNPEDMFLLLREAREADPG